MAQEDRINNELLVTFGAAGVVLILVTVVAVQALSLWGEQEQFDIKVIDRKPPELTELVTVAEEKLAQPKVLTLGANGKPDQVQIPIKTAMKLVIEENNVPSENASETQKQGG